MRREQLRKIIKEELDRLVSPGKMTVRVDGNPVTCEVASDDASRMRGLMGRRSLAEGEGMIFIFPSEQIQQFWMRNTHMPLDIIFADRSGRVINVESGIPLSEHQLRSSSPAIYVLEVRAGWAKRLGVGPGSQLTLDGI